MMEWLYIVIPIIYYIVPLPPASQVCPPNASVFPAAQAVDMRLWRFSGDTSTRFSTYSDNAAIAAAGLETSSRGWELLGVGTGRGAPCNQTSCTQSIAAAGCGWCAERQRCLQGGESAPFISITMRAANRDVLLQRRAKLHNSKRERAG